MPVFLALELREYNHVDMTVYVALRVFVLCLLEGMEQWDGRLLMRDRLTYSLPHKRQSCLARLAACANSSSVGHHGLVSQDLL